MQRSAESGRFWAGLCRVGLDWLTSRLPPSDCEVMVTDNGITVVLPAFNEARIVGTVVEGLRGVGARVVVVDDGSTDGTDEAAFRAGATVLRHPVNRGQGAALQTGILFALRARPDYIVTFDSDGQHDPADIPRVIEALEQSGADIVLGSRFLGRAPGISARRKMLLKGATFFTALTTGLRLSDAHNGLRVMTADCARRIRIRQDGMAHASEIIHQIRELSLDYVESPVSVRYTAYSKGKGQSGLGALGILYNLLVGRLR